MRENKTTEFKREFTEKIKNTVTAFANTDGGRILIGVDDAGKPIGLDDVDGTMLQATNMIRDTIRPDVTLFTDCAEEVIDGKSIVVVTVQRGTSRPYYLAGKGLRPEGVYVRQGASSVPASEAAILKMIRETGGERFEDARSLEQQLTFESAAAFFDRREVPFGDAQRRTLNLIGADGTYTNLGLLLSDQCPQTIKLAVFQGSRKTVFRDRRELTGSLFDQLEEGYAFIDLRNAIRSEIKGLERIDTRDYPPEAVREALLNAVAHRDYAVAAPTLISLFDDRVEFLNVGGLVPGVDLGDILLGVSALRNRNLAGVFYRLRLIEAYGSGIMKINECYEGQPVKPKIEVSGNAFKITLPNVNYIASAAPAASPDAPAPDGGGNGGGRRKRGTPAPRVRSAVISKNAWTM